MLNNIPLNSNEPLNGSTIQLSFQGSLIQIEQEVELLETFSGSLIQIEQSVNGLQSGSLIEIEQRVVASALSGCSDWSLVITIDGYEIPKSEIVGNISVTRRENNAALCEFTRRPGSGTFNATEHQGKTLTIDAEHGSTVVRVYTGIVDIPDVNILREDVTYRCTDRRRELINTQLGTEKNTLGYYSESIFGEAEDVYAEVQSRLTTVHKAIDFDVFGNYQITDLAPKSTADYTLGDSDIFSRNLRLEVTSRARIVNKVEINLGYRFPKLYHWRVGYTWTSPVFSQFRLFLAEGYTVPSKEMIRQAAHSAGWPLSSDITFTEMHAAGFYDLGVGFGGTVAWSPIRVAGATLVHQENPDGSLKYDDNGKPVYEHVTKDGILQDTGSLFCEGAQWTASNRWAQTITEDYTLTVQAPQSITKFGEVKRVQRYGLESDYDTTEWENYSGDDNTYVSSTTINKDTNRQEANNAIETVLNVAKTAILASHRDNRVRFTRDLWPEIDLKDTVELDTTEFDCIGKVSEVRHTFNASTREATTDIELSFSQSEGSASDTALNPPTPPTYTASQVVSTISLGNHYGKDPSQSSADNWTGMIGNRMVNGQLTKYPEYFVVDTPAVEDEARDNREVTQTGTYDVEIPDDTLTITWDGKCRG